MKLFKKRDRSDAVIFRVVGYSGRPSLHDPNKTQLFGGERQFVIQMGKKERDGVTKIFQVLEESCSDWDHITSLQVRSFNTKTGEDPLTKVREKIAKSYVSNDEELVSNCSYSSYYSSYYKRHTLKYKIRKKLRKLLRIISPSEEARK